MATAASPARPATSVNNQILFVASFATLIAAGIGFAVRGAVLKDWGQQYGFTQAELGTITGGGLAGFGLAIIFFSFMADLFGYGRLMLIAFVLHAASAVLTFAATPVYDALGKDAAFNCLFYGSLLFALGNGTCEAVINPLTATLFPRNKTHYLNILHAGWPLGLILGALIVLGFGQLAGPIKWEFKLGVFLLPVLLYGLMMFNRPFPVSEASASGVSTRESMGTVGGFGFAIAAGFIGLFLTSQLPPLLAKTGIDAPWAGWAVAGAIWVAYFVYSGLSFGSLLITVLYALHALVGYVELGTDSWITNITGRVLGSDQLALLAFIWTNALMFTLRFFAGPIVHRINPIGLLVGSAVAGTAGLYLMGGRFTGDQAVAPWILAVTIYGVGKTFYWPTLLGVISERFPRGGALALGISGGIGMLSAGLLGGPGIGYKQDLFAVQQLTADPADKPTYERYQAKKDDGTPAFNTFPLVSDFAPQTAPPVAGLDGAKLKVFDDYKAFQDKSAAAAKAGQDAPKGPPTTLEADLATIAANKADGKPVEAKLASNLSALSGWWTGQGRPNFAADQDRLEPARLFGSKQALLYTALVPGALVVGFLLLFVYFQARGGYKQVHLDGPGGGEHEVPADGGPEVVTGTREVVGAGR